MAWENLEAELAEEFAQDTWTRIQARLENQRARKLANNAELYLLSKKGRTRTEKDRKSAREHMRRKYKAGFRNPAPSPEKKAEYQRRYVAGMSAERKEARRKYMREWMRLKRLPPHERARALRIKYYRHWWTSLSPERKQARREAMARCQRELRARHTPEQKQARREYMRAYLREYRKKKKQAKLAASARLVA